jgi:hypothetical protein
MRESDKTEFKFLTWGFRDMLKDGNYYTKQQNEHINTLDIFLKGVKFFD